MTLGERIRERRKALGLSQEAVAERLGVSRQAVTKWERGQSAPSAENLLALAELLHISLEELAVGKAAGQRTVNPILRSNLTLLAILLQASALSACAQADYPVDGVPVFSTGMALFKTAVLLLCSLWMALNHLYEKNRAQRRRNARLECVYCAVQAVAGLATFYSGWYFGGSLVILGICLYYVLAVNPRYMNRHMVRRKGAPLPKNGPME